MESRNQNPSDETVKQRILIGNRIRQKRVELDLNQASFAHLLDISPSYLSSIERGHKPVSGRLIRNLHELTNMSYDYLMCGSDPLDLIYERYLDELAGAPTQNQQVTVYYPAASTPMGAGMVKEDASFSSESETGAPGTTSVRSKIDILLGTCNEYELNVCYQVCHSYLYNSRKQAKDR